LPLNILLFYSNSNVTLCDIVIVCCNA